MAISVGAAFGRSGVTLQRIRLMLTFESGINNMRMFTAGCILDSLQCYFFDLSLLLGLLCFYYCLSPRVVIAKLEALACLVFSPISFS